MSKCVCVCVCVCVCCVSVCAHRSSKKRIVSPVRSRECRHLQPFDLRAFLLVVSKSSNWLCPVCGCVLIRLFALICGILYTVLDVIDMLHAGNSHGQHLRQLCKPLSRHGDERHPRRSFGEAAPSLWILSRSCALGCFDSLELLISGSMPRPLTLPPTALTQKVSFSIVCSLQTCSVFATSRNLASPLDHSPRKATAQAEGALAAVQGTSSSAAPAGGALVEDTSTSAVDDIAASLCEHGQDHAQPGGGMC
jgi:hypothetical protein